MTEWLKRFESKVAAKEKKRYCFLSYVAFHHFDAKNCQNCFSFYSLPGRT